MSLNIKTSPLPVPTTTPPSPQRQEAEKVASDFEALFSQLVLKSMRNTARPEDESNALGIWTDMLDETRAHEMGQSGGLGIRDLVLNWILENDPSLKDSRKIQQSPGIKEKNLYFNELSTLK